MGASVLHSEAIFPVMKGKIPINIKNTFSPEDEGTMIVPNDKYNVMEGDPVITGIAGKKDFNVIIIEKSMMNAEVGFIRRVLSVIEHHGLCVEHLPSGIDTLSIVVSSLGFIIPTIFIIFQHPLGPEFYFMMSRNSTGKGEKMRVT